MTTSPAKPRSRLIDFLILLACAGVMVALIGTTARRSPPEPGDAQRHQQALDDLATLAGAVEKYAGATGRFPPKLDVLVPRYLKQIPLDPYGHKYKLFPGPDKAFLLYYGKDGRAKGYTPMDVDVVLTVEMPPPAAKTR